MADVGLRFPRSLQEADLFSPRLSGPTVLSDFKSDLLPLVGLDAVRNGGNMYKDVFAPVVRSDETETLVRVEILDRPSLHL